MHLSAAIFGTCNTASKGCCRSFGTHASPANTREYHNNTRAASSIATRVMQQWSFRIEHSIVLLAAIMAACPPSRQSTRIAHA
jgi:hypothetical protein